jgi:putative transposase
VPLLQEQVVTELVRISGQIEQRYEIVMACLGADKNHVPLLCSAHPKLGPGQIARMDTSITARELFKALPKLRKRLWAGSSGPSATLSRP